MSLMELLETLKNNFNISTITGDIVFRNISVQPYNSLKRDHRFGEKTCELYNIDISVHNVNISLRILSFIYVSFKILLKTTP